jgi:hemoglobin
MTNTPSVPHPENAERRAAITREIQAATGLDETVLERLVRTFYDTARRDEVIGRLFDGVQDWEHHIEKITAFWSSVALMTGRYHGYPLGAHFPLPLQPPHFARWLVLFEKTAREVCTEAGAELLIEKAHRIARSLEMGVAVSRGELPPRARASA